MPTGSWCDMKFPGEIDLLYLVVRDEKYLKTLADGDMTEAEDAQLFAGVPEEWKHEQRDGIMFIGDRGRLFVNRGRAPMARPWRNWPRTPCPPTPFDFTRATTTWLISSSASRAANQPISTVDVAHRVISSCHLANVAMQLKRKIRWDPEQEQIIGDARGEPVDLRTSRTAQALHDRDMRTADSASLGERADVLRVGIIGFGFMGRMHYRCWKALTGVAVTAVCDADPQRLGRLGQEPRQHRRGRGRPRPDGGEVLRRFPRDDRPGVARRRVDHRADASARRFHRRGPRGRTGTCSARSRWP